MPPPKTESGRQPWQPRHTDILIRGIIDLVSTHRKELYKLPGLVGEVDDHGSDRIKKKVDQLMRGLGAGAGLGARTGITGVGTQEGGGGRKRRKAEHKVGDGMSGVNVGVQEGGAQ